MLNGENLEKPPRALSAAKFEHRDRKLSQGEWNGEVKLAQEGLLRPKIE